MHKNKMHRISKWGEKNGIKRWADTKIKAGGDAENENTIAIIVARSNEVETVLFL